MTLRCEDSKPCRPFFLWFNLSFNTLFQAVEIVGSSNENLYLSFCLPFYHFFLFSENAEHDTMRVNDVLHPIFQNRTSQRGTQTQLTFLKAATQHDALIGFRHIFVIGKMPFFQMISRIHILDLPSTSKQT